MKKQLEQELASTLTFDTHDSDDIFDDFPGRPDSSSEVEQSVGVLRSRLQDFRDDGSHASHSQAEVGHDDDLSADADHSPLPQRSLLQPPSHRRRTLVLKRLRCLATESRKEFAHQSRRFSKTIKSRFGTASERKKTPATNCPEILSVDAVQSRDDSDGQELMYKAQLRLALPREHTWYTEPFSLDDLLTVVVKVRQAAVGTRLCAQVPWCAFRDTSKMMKLDNKFRSGSNPSALLMARWPLYLISIALSILAVWYLAGALRPWMLRILESEHLSFARSYLGDTDGADWIVSFALAMQFWLILASLLAGVTETAILPAKAILQFERKDTLELVKEQLHLLLKSGDCFQNLDVCNFLNLGMATYYGTSATQKEGRVFCRQHESAEVYFMQAHRRAVSLLCFSCEWRCQWRWKLSSDIVERWCVLGKDGLILFASIMDRDPTDVLYFDSSYSVFRDGQDTLLVCCAAWVLELYFGEPTHSKWLRLAPQTWRRHGSVLSWCNAITAAAQRSPCTKMQRYGSFAPVRHATQGRSKDLEQLRVSLARFLIGGRVTFRKIAEAILMAKSEVFICGWWVSPHLQMVREGKPLPNAEDSRLSSLLRGAADRGVRVYVLLWQETYMPNDSEFCEAELRHPGIFVARHRSRFDINLLWSHHEKVVVVDQQLAFLGGLDLCLGRYDDRQHRLRDTQASVWTGQDYSNPRLGDFVEARNGKDFLDRSKQPRMPWQDVHCMVLGLPAHDIARHCFERWNHAKSRSTDYANFPTALLRTNTELSNQSLLVLLEERADMSWPPEFGRWKECDAQVVRSVGRWSAGTPTESSIHAAYCDMIQGAEHFIYIENQFFCSGLDGDVSVGNRIVEALFQRILKAYRHNELFHVMMVLPLLPAFDGIIAKGPSPLLYVMHWQYRTIRMLREQLSCAGCKFDKFVSIFGLRKLDTLEGQGPVTEEIYIHSKVMIADDKRAIIGSANLNDRSLLGMRDSELCVVLEDPAAVITKDGIAAGLRRALLAKHFGRPRRQDEPQGEAPAISPISSSSEPFWKEAARVAKTNSQVFEELFECIPSDRIKTWNDLAARRAANKQFTLDALRRPTQEEVDEAMSKLRGYIVQYPIDFLRDEDLAPTAAATALKPMCWQADAFN